MEREEPFPYLHFGIYSGSNTVIHFTDNGRNVDTTIMETSFKDFLGDKKRYCICPITGIEDLNDPDEEPSKVPLLAAIFDPALGISMYIAEGLLDLYRELKFHLYSPDETVRRARSCIGKGGYNLFTNNCEHFVVWCKTGLHESKQIEVWIKELRNIAKSIFVP